MMVMHYGAPPFWPEGEKEPARVQVPFIVYPEDVARQLRELREMVQALRGDKGETVTPSEMVRRILGAVVDADPEMLAVIREFLTQRGVP